MRLKLMVAMVNSAANRRPKREWNVLSTNQNTRDELKKPAQHQDASALQADIAIGAGAGARDLHQLEHQQLPQWSQLH